MRKRNIIGRNDFKWSYMGDFVVSKGDIEDTREIQGLGFMEEVERRVSSGFDDWKLSQEDGANIHIYEGRINNEATWRDISDSISFSFTRDFFLSPVDFQVFVAPVSTNEVAVRVEFSDNIRREMDPKINSLKIVYNLEGQGPFVMR